MTEAQAHEFLSKWSRRWFGRRRFIEGVTTNELKSSCLFVLLPSLTTLCLGLDNFFSNPEINGWYYFRIGIVAISFVVASISTWVLVRFWQACKVLGRKF